jgi:hypothetical protein
MRYNLDSTLPINAFSPRGGLFAYGMTLEGGGGGGILKPVTNVLGGAAKAITGGVKAVVQPVYNATLKQIPGVDKALVGVDKAVGKSIPGGWGTVAAVASSFIPGASLAAMGMTRAGLATGLGALSGSGVMRGKNEFNLQGAIMGGAMAYGASQLSSAFQEAGKGVTEAATKTTSDLIADAGKEALSPEQLKSLTSGDTGILNKLSAGIEGGAGQGLQVAPDVLPNAIPNISGPLATTAPIPGSIAAQNAYELQGLDNGQITALRNSPSMLDKIGTSITEAPKNIGNFLDKATTASTYNGIGTNLAEAGKGTLSNIGDAGQGIANLTGFGADGSAAAAREAFTGAASPITKGGLAGLIMGGTGLAALEEQQKLLDEQASSGAISNAEYNVAKAKIDEQVATARATVSANPLQTSADTSNLSEGPSLYAKKSTGFDTLYDKNPSGGTNLYEQTPVGVASGGMINRYAMGGAVNPRDDETNLPNQTPMQRFENNGLMSMIGNTAPQQMYAAGGIASGRFLSGGGDGMSDSIKASINGSQEARLADGEFVIPADVVSHIGNGSSKAGAKQLYSMMDRVRQARVGNKKQGKQINPRKFLAA